MFIEKREYQDKAVKDAVDFINEGKTKGVVVLPTAAGKSIVIARIIQELGDPGTLVLQPSVELLKQNFKKYTTLGGTATLYSASANSKVASNVTYATPLSFDNGRGEFNHVKLVIIDECHLGVKDSSTVITRIIKSLGKGVQVIGLTATPLLLKNYVSPAGYYSQLNMLVRVRPKFWHHIVHVTQVKELQELGYLSFLRFTSINRGLRNVKISGSDYSLKEVSKVIETKDEVTYIRDLALKCKDKGKNKILIFMPTVENALKLKGILPGSEVVQAKTGKNDRVDIVESFVEGDLIYLINYGTLLTGFDAPKIDLIICARPTMSYYIWYQLIGRGMRKCEGKYLCDIIDLAGNFKEFGDPVNMTFEDHPTEGWGMYVKDYLMSGVPLGQKVHKSELGVLNMTVEFGNKYRGVQFKDVPTSYLEWVAENMDLTTAFAKKHIIKPLKSLGILAQ